MAYYEVDNTIRKQAFKGLQVVKLVSNDTLEILSISLEKGAVFPRHDSPKDAHLIMLSGHIDFHINETLHVLVDGQHFNFPKNKEHWVAAREHSKFLIIR